MKLPVWAALLIIAGCTSRDRSAPDSAVASDRAEHVVAATVGRDHACAISSTGTAFCWGAANSRLLGADVDSVKDAVPVRVAGNHKFKSIAAGETFTCAIGVDGKGFCWGKGDNGELGGGRLYDQALTPRNVSGEQRFTSIVAGRQHACALDATGAAWCWGNNEHGQIGNDIRTQYAQRPVRVAGTHRFKQLGVSGGANTTCGVTVEGTGVCWGSNTHGQLGNGATTASNQLVVVPGLSNLREISAGPDVACALTEDGGVYCWGSNRFGQLGLSGAEASVPHPSGRVETNEKFRSVTAGPQKACALGETGQAYCWGSNADNLLNATANDLCTERSLPCAKKPERVSASLFRQLSIGSSGQVCGAGQLHNASVICWGSTVTSTGSGGPVIAQNLYLWKPDLAADQGVGAGSTSAALPAGFESLTLAEKMARSPLDSVPEDAGNLLLTLLPEFVAFYPEHYPESARNAYQWSPYDGLSIIRANLSGGGLSDFVIAGRDSRTQLIVAVLRDSAQRTWTIKTVSYGIARGETLSPRVTLQRGAGLHPNGRWDAVLVRHIDDPGSDAAAQVERFYWDPTEKRFYLIENPSRGN